MSSPPPRFTHAAPTTDASSRAHGPSGVAGPTYATLRVLASPCAALVDTAHVLDGTLWLLGREIDGPGLCAEDARLSRLHARVLWDTHAGGYRVGDAQSRNGSFLNGERVDSALLSAGDLLRVGDTLLLFEMEDRTQQLLAQADRAATSALHLLLRGETGTGKEVLARRIHAHSGRRGEFVAVNCAGLSRDLMASELFGHTRGAFSGAVNARKGLFAQAEGGTLLLDEVGDCPLEVQAGLLRALQEHKVRPVGSERELPVDVRIIAATHRDLEQAVADGTFRADLYARLSQLTLHLSPLRERRREIIPLLRGFAGASLRLSTDACETLLLWSWPYNVRELESLGRKFAVMAGPGAELDIHYLRQHHPELAALLARQRSEGAPSVRPTPASERGRIMALLDAHGGNVSEVAREVGKPRAQVYRWMRTLGLSAQKFRK